MSSKENLYLLLDFFKKLYTPTKSLISPGILNSSNDLIYLSLKLLTSGKIIFFLLLIKFKPSSVVVYLIFLSLYINIYEIINKPS